jgi:hypothetical protein
MGQRRFEDMFRQPLDLEVCYERATRMALVKTDLELPYLQRNEGDFSIVRKISESADDGPVLMLNMNRYRAESGYPDGGVYQQYISGLEKFLPGAGAKILWRVPVFGQAVGDQKIDELIACWYPVHKIFLNLYDAPGAVENFRLKGLCVEYAVIHRCPGDRYPFAPEVTMRG